MCTTRTRGKKPSSIAWCVSEYAPETSAWEYPMGDDSWAAEMAEFQADVRARRVPSAGLADAHAALSVVARIYGQSGLDPR